MRFETRIYNYSADDKIIGAEVTVYDEEGDKLDRIIITDETKLQELEEQLETIDSNYVTYVNLNEILANSEETTIINATKLNGYQGDAFVLLADIQDNTVLASPKPHATSATTYGVGSTTNYGHVKIRDNLTAANYTSGEALASHQGKILDDKITEIKTVTTRQLHSKFMLAKRNGTVQLTIEDWDGNTWLAGRSGWQTITTIPEGFRPAALNQNVTHIYCPNLFGYHLRIRINISTNAVEIWSDGSDTIHNFFGTVTWITND